MTTYINMYVQYIKYNRHIFGSEYFKNAEIENLFTKCRDTVHGFHMMNACYKCVQSTCDTSIGLFLVARYPCVVVLSVCGWCGFCI